jgi:hypothetical protein
MVVNELDGMAFSCPAGSSSLLPIPVGALRHVPSRYAWNNHIIASHARKNKCI